LACRLDRCGWYCLTGGCMALPGYEGACEEVRSMDDRMDWIDWITELVEAAEVAGLNVEMPRDRERLHRKWESGKSVDEVLEELSE